MDTDTTGPMAVFHYSNREVRAVLVDGEPWFVAADIARILGYDSAKDMARRLDEDEKGRHSVPTLGGAQEMTVISEPGLYAATLGSRVEGAKAFKRWVTHEVLPAIRKTGAYSIHPAAAPSIEAIGRRELALMVIQAEDARAAAEEKVAKLEPEAVAYRTIIVAEGSSSPTAVAKMLRTGGCRIKDREIFEYMHDKRLIYRSGGSGHWLPYAEAQADGLVVQIHGGAHRGDSGELKANKPKVQVTGLGIDWLRHHLLSERGSTIASAGQTQLQLVASE